MSINELLIEKNTLTAEETHKSSTGTNGNNGTTATVHVRALKTSPSGKAAEAKETKSNQADKDLRFEQSVEEFLEERNNWLGKYDDLAKEREIERKAAFRSKHGIK